MGKKLTYEYVKKQIEDEGYTLLSDSYKGAHVKLLIKCPEGHEYEVRFSNFKKGTRCPYCAGLKKLTYEYVKKQIEKEGYTLLSNSYKNVDNKLLLKCLEGHEYKISYYNFKKGQRCPICAINRKKLTYEHVKKQIESKGYTLLSDTYKNNYTKIKIQCSEGHKYKVTYNKFQQGTRCPICANIKNGLKKRLLYEYVKEYIESFGYTLLSDSYKNVNTKIKVQCPEGHKYKVTYSSFKQGTRCPYCAAELGSSKGEKEVVNFVRAQGIDIIENDRSQIINPLTNKNLELDIWIPSLNKAIEYNGLYWHSFKDVIKHDKIKKEQCEKLGIDLLIIQEDNWQKYQQLEMGKIKKWLLT